MLDPKDVQRIDDLQSSIQKLLDEAVKQYGQLAPAEKNTLTKVIRALDASWSKLLADVGESEVEVPEKSIRALLACGCVMACMMVVQADDEISAEEHEVLLQLTGGLAEPLSLGGMSPVSPKTTSGTIEYYTHLVDAYDVMDHRVAGTLCAAIDAYRDTELMSEYSKSVTQLGKQISFVDGHQADQREQSVLEEFEHAMRRLTEAINSAKFDQQ